MPRGVCPFAVWRPLKEAELEPAINPTQVILHTAVSNAASLFAYFNRDDVFTESHFYINQQGLIEQYINIFRQADANWDANVRAISVETWDGGLANIPPLNQAQVNSYIKLCEWIITETSGAVARRLCPSWNSPGFGYHRQYIQWNKSNHSCPGDAKVQQFNTVILPALLNPVEDDMFTDADRALLKEARDKALDAQVVARAMFQGNFEGGSLKWLDDHLVGGTNLIMAKLDDLEFNLTIIIDDTPGTVQDLGEFLKAKLSSADLAALRAALA